MAGLACLGVAAVYAVAALRLQKGTSARPLPSPVLRWGHSLAWVLLAGWAFARHLLLPGAVGGTLAVLGALVYAAFLATLVRSRRGGAS
jgi:hypothetical protein